MVPRSIPLDTDPRVFDMLVERWRAMTIADRVELIGQMNHDVEVLAVAGIRSTSPHLSDIEVQHELARRRFGSELADGAFRDLFAG